MVNSQGQGFSPLGHRLLPGETILWAGQPHARAYALRGSWFLLPFGLLWTAITLGAFVGSASLVALPFVLFGLYMTFGRLWVAAREAENTYYAVTNRRILIQSGADGAHLLQLALMPPLLLSAVWPQGVGTIYFRSRDLASDLLNWRTPGMPAVGQRRVPEFVSVPNAAEVCRIIEQALAGRAEPADATYGPGQPAGFPPQRREQPQRADTIVSGAQLLQEQLQPAEHVLWQGKPNRDAYLRRAPWLIPISVVWTAVFVFIAVSAPPRLGPGGQWMAILFVLVGLYFTVGRFWVAAREADNAEYMVTSERIVIRRGAFRPQLIALRLSTLPYLQVEEQGRGCGTIYFNKPGPNQWASGPGWIDGRAPVPAFISIDHADRVYRIVERARNRALQPAPPEGQDSQQPA